MVFDICFFGMLQLVGMNPQMVNMGTFYTLRTQ